MSKFLTTTSCDAHPILQVEGRDRAAEEIAAALGRIEEYRPSPWPSGTEYEPGDPGTRSEVEKAIRGRFEPSAKTLGVGDVGFDRSRSEEAERLALLEDSAQ